MADRTLEDPLAEALRIIGLADGAGFQVRLMGGLAFHARAPEWTARIDRSGRDIDLATRSNDRKALSALLIADGYVPDRQYNAAFGHKQLYFTDPAWARPVDILVDRLEMCHQFEFASRLSVDQPTLPLAELLMSKLQIVRINRKDALDVLILLQAYPLAVDDRGGISLPRIVAHTSTDWGWWRTITENLDKLDLYVDVELGDDDLDTGRPPRFDLHAQIAALRTAIDAAPKSTRWRLRAKVGDKVAWYELPEEVGHGR
ncbi:MAG: hypothetical protein C0498_01110 [Anaerolinea sp.]|jgi:hypothetical protein|nr:hypothetical protein [Anaerolinea sp.]